MSEYIERGALLKRIAEEYDLNYGEILVDPCKFKDMVDEAPAADVVEVKHGRWQKRQAIIFDSELTGYRCSECKTTWETEMNYCPNCGCCMDGGTA